MDEKHARRREALRRLLSLMAVGGREPILDLEDWLTRLTNGRRTAPVQRWFAGALTCEWLDIEAPTSLCADVTEHVMGYLQHRPGPWANVWGHTLRVTGYALRIAEMVSADLETVFLTAILHDVRKLDERGTGDYHEDLGADYARHLLNGEIPGAQILTIVKAIGIHPERPPASWPVACILHDADKLDKVGATGLLRRASAGEDEEEACEGAWRMLDDAEYLPPLCFQAARTHLLQPKMRFVRTLGRMVGDVCD